MGITPKDIAAQRAMLERGDFAAAALTGWLASQQTVINAAEMAARSYKYADAMLRVRERTTTNASPEAGRPSMDAEGERVRASVQSTGNTQQPQNGALSPCETVHREPVAFAVVRKEMTGIDVYDDAYDAAEYAAVLNRKGWTANVVRLVPQSSPTLTAEEREAIHRAEARLRTAYVPDDATAATLRKLLERLK
jgi:hypothetical protein